jgi:hypothetical protein
VKIPGAVDVRILRGPELHGALLFGFTDGCYKKGRVERLIKRLEGHLDDPDRFIERIRELDPWMVEESGGPARADDRSAFALRARSALNPAGSPRQYTQCSSFSRSATTSRIFLSRFVLSSKFRV